MAMDSTGRDMLLVLDVDSASTGFGQVVGELALDTAGGMPHHIERRVGDDSLVFANGWIANRSWIFDVGIATRPVVRATFQSAGGAMAWAHDFTRLPNGNVLVAFNGGPGAYVGPGGVAEVDRDGAVIQSAMATMPAARSAPAGRTSSGMVLGEQSSGNICRLIRSTRRSPQSLRKTT